MIVVTTMDLLPLWALFILTLAIILLAFEAGWRLGRYRQKRSGSEAKPPVGAAVGTTLGLLAFLLAFTFGMAGERYGTRRQVVLQEANAIGTVYLRTDFLPEQQREASRELLRKYAVLRAGGRASILSAQGREQSAEIHAALWEQAAQAQKIADTVSTGLYIQSLNELIDLDETRVTATRSQIPDGIWLMLYLVAILSFAAMGFQFGVEGVRSWAVTLLMAVVFTTVIVLIADLDRPQGGLLLISQQPLLDVIKSIGTPTP